MKLVALTKQRYACVDDGDFDFVSQFNWSYHGRGYAGCQTLGAMHRVIAAIHDMDAERNIDHRSGCRLDNRLANLRAATSAENARNRRCSGVSLDKRRPTQRPWRAVIKIDGKRVFLGQFSTEHEARSARVDAERKYFGDYAPDRTQRCPMYGLCAECDLRLPPEPAQIDQARSLIPAERPRIRRSNISGVEGVSWCERDQRWIAEIRVNRKRVFWQAFKTVAEAAIAREAALNSLRLEK